MWILVHLQDIHRKLEEIFKLLILHCLLHICHSLLTVINRNQLVPQCWTFQHFQKALIRPQFFQLFQWHSELLV